MTFPAKVVHLGLEGIRAKWDEIIADYDAVKYGYSPFAPPRAYALRRFAELGITEGTAARWLDRPRAKPKGP